MISLLHPSRGRPRKAFDSAMKWISMCGLNDIEYILSIDEDEPFAPEYQRLFDGHKYIVRPNKNAVEAINNAAKEAKGDLIVVMSDDFECPNNWGQVIEKATRGKTDFLLKVHDGVQNWIVTLPIMDRVYYERFGYIYYPEYKHMFCDTELTHVADLTKKMIVRNDIVFKHKHYSITKEAKDEVTKKADNTWNQGKALYISRANKSFGTGLDVFDLSGNAKAHVAWLRATL